MRGNGEILINQEPLSDIVKRIEVLEEKYRSLKQ